MKRLTVYLNAERVGVLTDGDEPGFTYDAGWLAGNTALPLSRQLPLRGEEVRDDFGGVCRAE